MHKLFICKKLQISDNKNSNSIGEGTLICNGGASINGNIIVSGNIISKKKIITNFDWEDLKKSILPKKELKDLNIGSEECKWNNLYINNLISTKNILTDNIKINSDTLNLNNLYLKNIDCIGKISTTDLYIDGSIENLSGPIRFNSNIVCKNISLNNIKYNYELLNIIDKWNSFPDINCIYHCTEIIINGTNNSDNVVILNLKDLLDSTFYGCEKKIIINKNNIDDKFKLIINYSNNNKITLIDEAILYFIYTSKGFKLINKNEILNN